MLCPMRHYLSLCALVAVCTGYALRGATLPDETPPLRKITVLSSNNRVIDERYRILSLATSPRTPELKRLREFIASKVDLVQMRDPDLFIAAMDWVHRQWVHDGRRSPSLDMSSVEILQSVGKGMRYNCEGYARVLVDVLASFGHVARIQQLRTVDVAYGAPGRGHVVVEAWSNTLNKWIYLDPQMNVFMRQDSTYLNALEGLNALKMSAERGASVLRVPTAGVRNAQTDMERYLHDYETFVRAFNGSLTIVVNKDGKSRLLALLMDSRDQYLTFQGLPADGTTFTDDARDIYMPVNRTALTYYFDKPAPFDSVMQRYPIRTKDDYVRVMPRFAAEPSFQVELEHGMPWFDHFEVTFDDATWRKVKGAALPWQLQDGPHSIAVRAVNVMGVNGPPVAMRISYGVER